MGGPEGGAGAARAGGAGLSIAEWAPPHAAAWLRGLNGAIAPYVPLFLARKVQGQQLLTLRSDDLESLGVNIIGHQELLLEAIEHLRNFHYELQRENLQQLAMRLSCVATSLYNELRLHQDSTKVETQCLSDLAHVIAAVKPLVCWLDRSPFFEQIDYSERKSALLKLSLEAATCAQRDRFAERPAQAVAAACRQLAALADYIIQDVADPMILQPASLDTVVLKKKDNQLGFDIVPSFSGHHQIANIKFGSPAHASGKIEEGDEIVQVNYQTVIGWCPELARRACLSFVPDDPNHTSHGHSLTKDDLILTLRRRPGARAAALATPQLRPFRPLRRPWAGGGIGGNIMPNRIRFWDNRDVLALRFRVPSVEPTPEVEEGDRSSSDESEILSPPSSPTTLEQDAQHRLYLPKPRSQVHRRNTISGSSPISKRPNVSIEQFWQELKNQKSLNHTGSAQMGGADDHEEISNNLYRRDKAMSVSTGLELSPRPKTCLGVGLNHPIINKLKAKNKFLNDENANPTDAANGDMNSAKNRGKLDKSHSTPAYDFDSNGNEEPNSLVTQIIPESPTTPTDSPTIIIHSAEKADQILDFKKSSSQIGEAILQQQNKQKDLSADADSKVKFNFPAVDNSNFAEDSKKILKTGSDKIMETINIAMMERQNRDNDKKITTKQSSFKAQSVFVSDKGEKSTKTFSVNEHVQTIQNEIVQAINEQRLITTMHITKTKQTLSDVPPEPPPRPLSTQRQRYMPKEFLVPIKDHRMKDYPPLKSVKNPDVLEPKDYPPLKPVKPEISPHISPPIKHFTKQDIHMIPNVDINPPLLPNRKEILVPINYEAKDIPKSVLSFEKKNNQFNVMSNPDLTSKSINLGPDLRTETSDLAPLTQSQSLQRLEIEGRPTLIIPSPSRMESAKVLSPSNSVVRGIFPSTKSKSLKKKNSILAKRRKISVKDLGPGDLQGTLYQRCRTKSNTTVVWDQKWYVLQGNTLYGFKSKDGSRADCLIFLNGFTVSAAQEVKSKQFAFKVYHTGTVFYFAAESSESMNTWYEYISKATMLNYDSWERAHKKDKKVDESKHFSETDYSDDDFCPDKDGTEKHKNEGKEKEKSKFGSLKKFTNRIHKSESQENVSHSTSLDRKYLRFFKSSKHKEDKAKAKNLDIPVPTEQYRSYRKMPSSSQPVTLQVPQLIKLQNDVKENVSDKLSQNLAKIKKMEPVDTQVTAETDNLLKFPKSQKIPKPINYAHASNPNLLDFEKSDFVAKPSPLKPKIQRPDNVLGFVTLEQFMLKKQEEERREVYSNRVLMGIERDSRKEEKNSNSKKANELQKQWENIIPDVIYGELPTHEEALLPVSVEQIQNRSLPKTPEKPATSNLDVKTHEYVHIPDDITKKDAQINNKDNAKPISVKGKDGYEKIVYSAIPADIKKPEDRQKEPPKILPRKHSLVIPDDLTKASPEIFKKCSLKSVKDVGYESIYGDGKHKRSISNCSDLLTSSDSKSISKTMSMSGSRDLGYETIYGTDKSTDSVSKKSSTSSIASSQIDEIRVVPRKMSGEKPVPPPKIMPKSKQVLNRQSSLTCNSNRNSGPDMNPVFVQGESPEKFWLNSLRRNDKVHNSKSNENNPNKNEKFYTKRSEPSAYTKSSEATIVKSDKANKNIEPFGSKTAETKVLKSATQYTPMSLPLNASNALKTSPKFEMTLDSKDPPATSGISRLRQIFQNSAQSASKLRPSTPSPTGSVKEKTILGSPRLHRAIFRKQHGAAQSSEDFCQEFTYTKGPHVESYPDNQGIFPTGNIGDEMTTMRNMSTPEYPHLEYPPTFEPESYSLADPNTSFNLLRRKNMEEKK